MLKKIGIGLGIFFVTLYALFLIVPFFISGIVNSYSGEISKMIEEASGFKVKLENIRIITTPKLTAGGGVGHIEAALPSGETFLTADNAGGKLSLLPLLLRKIEIDVVGAENVNLNLKVKKDGKFLIEDYIPQTEKPSNPKEPMAELPFGIKLSNHLPNIVIKNYNISFIDMPTDKTYSIYGQKAKISDFILDKKIKLTADGKFMLQEREQFSYDVKVLNKVMPDIDLNDLVFSQQTVPQPQVQPQPAQPFNIIDIFKAIHNNQLTADVIGDITTFGTFEDINFDGIMNVSNLGIAVDGKKLPPSNIDIKLKGNTINLYTKLYTAEKELTELVGNFKTGKHPKIDLNCKSNAQFKSIIDMIDSIAQTFGYKDLETLTAAGGIDADFTLKSNLKKTESSGYFKVPSASLAYKLYNFAIANIKADIDFANNSPDFNVNLTGVNYKDVPSNTNLNIAGVNLVKNIVNLSNVKVTNPAAIVTVPTAKVVITEKEIAIENAKLIYDNIKLDIKGKISDYLAQNIKLDFVADGIGQIALKGALNDVYKALKLDLNLLTNKTVSMEIPGLPKSNVKTDFNIHVGGNALNPILKGAVQVPSLSIPDMLVSMQDMNVSLNGPVARGKGTLKKFTSGGIVAENLGADFDLTGNVFNLKNITGDAFSGKVGGNVSYNIVNGHIGVDFKGSGMDAEKAIAGAAGLKNALSGKLGFNANVTLHGATDVEMMKNLKGKVSFDIQDGKLGNIGRFENFLFADNISSNSVLKAAVNSVSALPAIKNTAEFKTISGDLSFNNGWANLNPIKVIGPSMAYYITGRYNLLNATANVVVLGRLSAEVVKLLGPLGDLSVEKLTSYIPKFGNMTGRLINALTTDPKKENISAIPQLSSGNKNYKDFKVQFNGGVESRSSVKSFKWLSKCDTSAIETVTVKEQVQQTKQAVQEAVQQKKDAVNELLEQRRKEAEASRQQLQDAKEGLKNLKNLLK